MTSHQLLTAARYALEKHNAYPVEFETHKRAKQVQHNLHKQLKRLGWVGYRVSVVDASVIVTRKVV
jgi:hypothetical protein